MGSEPPFSPRRRVPPTCCRTRFIHGNLAAPGTCSPLPCAGLCPLVPRPPSLFFSSSHRLFLLICSPGLKVASPESAPGHPCLTVRFSLSQQVPQPVLICLLPCLLSNGLHVGWGIRGCVHFHGMAGKVLRCFQLSGSEGLLAPSRLRPGMLRDTPQCPEWPFAESDLAPHANTAKAENLLLALSPCQRAHPERHTRDCFVPCCVLSSEHRVGALGVGVK